MATIGHGVDHTISQTNAPIVVRTTHLYPLQSHYRSSRVYLGAPLPFGSAQSVRSNSREWPQTIGRHTLYWPVELSGHDVGIEWRTRRLNKQAFECKANTTDRVVWRRSPRGWTKLATWTTSFGPLCKTGQQVIDGRDETSFFHLVEHVLVSIINETKQTNGNGGTMWRYISLYVSRPNDRSNCIGIRLCRQCWLWWASECRLAHRSISH